jgi:hypothetical protein
MAVGRVDALRQRILAALSDSGIPHALVGGQAVAAWVATKDPDAVRTTKNVDLLIDRRDLPKARAAAHSVELDYFEVMNVGMFLERDDPNPRRGVHLVWAGEKIKAEYPHAAPSIDRRVEVEPGQWAVSLIDLVVMKLMANREQDRVHLRDMIDVGLVDATMIDGVPEQLRSLLKELLIEQGKGLAP